MYMGMHDKIGRLRPFCAPADEPDELLPGAKSVYYGCCCIASKSTPRAKSSNSFGGCSISDGCGIMPKTLGADPSSTATTFSDRIRLSE